MKATTTTTSLPMIRVRKVARLAHVPSLGAGSKHYSNQTITTVWTVGV